MRAAQSVLHRIHQRGNSRAARDTGWLDRSRHPCRPGDSGQRISGGSIQPIHACKVHQCADRSKQTGRRAKHHIGQVFDAANHCQQPIRAARQSGEQIKRLRKAGLQRAQADAGLRQGARHTAKPCIHYVLHATSGIHQLRRRGHFGRWLIARATLHKFQVEPNHAPLFAGVAHVCLGACGLHSAPRGKDQLPRPRFIQHGQQGIAQGQAVIATHKRLDSKRPRGAAQVFGVRRVALHKFMHLHAPANRHAVGHHFKRHTPERGSLQRIPPTAHDHTPVSIPD